MPSHAAVHAPDPQWIVAPEQASAAHWIAHDAVPHVRSWLPHASPPPRHSRVHAYMVGHITLPPSHASVPSQTTLHAYSWGHTMSSPSQAPSPVQSIVQTLPSQPPVHSRGQAPAPGGAGSTEHMPGGPVSTPPPPPSRPGPAPSSPGPAPSDPGAAPSRPVPPPSRGGVVGGVSSPPQPQAPTQRGPRSESTIQLGARIEELLFRRTVGNTRAAPRAIGP